jgi:VWFA-related protein
MSEDMNQRPRMMATHVRQIIIAVVTTVYLLLGDTSSVAFEEPAIELRSRVYVVAVRTQTPTKGLFVPCSWASWLQVVPPDAKELFSTEGGTIPGGTPDSKVKDLIEKELRKRKYIVAESVEGADFVFLVQATYTAYIAGIVPGTSAYPSPDWGTPPPPDTTWEALGEPDENTNVLSSSRAIVVASDVYRRHATDIGALLAAALWQGVSEDRQRGHTPGGVLLSDLVKQFQGQKKLPSSRTFCALSQPVRAAIQPSSGRTPHPLDMAPIMVPVMVMDDTGKTILDMAESEFHIFEDDVEQPVDSSRRIQQGLSIGFLVDTSQSMFSHFNEIRSSLALFLQSVRRGDRFLIVSFNDRVYLDSEFSDDGDQLVRAVSQMQPGDSTRFFDALELATSQRLDAIEGAKAIFLVTDGVDIGSGLCNARAIIDKMGESMIPIFILQYDTRTFGRRPPARWKPDAIPEGYLNRDEVYERATQQLEELAARSGGRLYRADRDGNLSTVFAHAMSTLRDQYTLRYYPRNTTRDGSYRRIHIAVDRPGCHIASPSGYRAAAVGPVPDPHR